MRYFKREIKKIILKKSTDYKSWTRKISISLISKHMQKLKAFLQIEITL